MNIGKKKEMKIMTITIHVNRKNEYKRGQVIKLHDPSPSKQMNDKFKIIKQLSYSKVNEVAEYRVEPVRIPKDPNHMRGWHR